MSEVCKKVGSDYNLQVMERNTLEEPRKRLDPETKKRLRPGYACILDEQLIEQFCDLIYKGLPADGVCDYLGIAYMTFWSWKQKGEKYLLGDGEPAEYEIYGEFVLQFKRALAGFRINRTNKMLQTGNRDWFKELTVLSRRDRKTYSERDQSPGSEDESQADERFL